MKEESLKKEIRKSLKKIIDPEIGINIVDLGLVYDISINKTKVHIEMTFTTSGCPIIPYFLIQARRAAESVDGVDEAEVEIVWEPAWSQDMITEAGIREIKMRKKRVDKESSK